MNFFQGTFAPTEMGWRDRLWWARRNMAVRLPRRRQPGDSGAGEVIRREWGGWTVRARRGWRKVRWITPPLHYTRSIARSDERAAEDWAMARMGM